MPNNQWYRFYPGDFLRDTQHLSLEEEGAYRRLIDHYMMTGRPIPDDLHRIRRILRVSLQKTRCFLPILREFFIEKDGKLFHKKCEAELAKTLKRHEHAVAAGRAGGQASAKAKGVAIPEPEPEPEKNKVVDIKNISTTSSDSPSGKSDRAGVPFRQIVDAYHELLPMLPRVEKLTKVRQGLIRQRWLEDLPTLVHWRNYFKYVAQSNFLIGKAPPQGDKPPFRADLEWLCRPSNFTKVAEKKYHHGRK